MSVRRVLFVAAVGLVACGSGGSKKRPARRDGGAIRVVDDSTGVAAGDEKEPNDEAGNAQPLAPPQSVRGTIGTAGDRDVYALSVKAPGTLSAKLTAVADADLILDLEDVTGAVVASSDGGPAKTAEGIPNYAVRPGTYRVVVREFVKRPKHGKVVPRAAPSAPYVLSVDLGAVPAAGEEVEPNEDATQAMDLPLGGAVKGFIGWNGDADNYRVPLEGAGDDQALSVDVDGVPRVALRVAVRDAAGALLLERQGRAGEPVSVRNVAIKEGEASCFVSVSGAKGNDTDRYTVRVTTVPFELDEEAEPNDNPAAANPIADIPGADGGTRVGFLGRGDTDCFAVEPADRPRRLHATLEPPADVDGELAVVDKTGADVAGARVNKAKRGGAERVSDVPIAASQAVFVCVRAMSGESATDRYRLRWSAVPDETAPAPGMDEP